METAALLGSVKGAEEQKEMLDKMTKLQEQNREVSARLHEMVLELAGAAAGIREISVQNQNLMIMAEQLAGE